MAGNIKGITVEIGGNTAPLDTALKGVNKTSRDLQSELKQVGQLLKLDPTNTELLAQKQKLLADSVSTTKNKLDTLKEAEKQVQEQFAQGKVSEQQYRSLQREIITTEQKLKGLESQSNGTSEEVKVLGTNIDSTSKNTNDLESKAGIATKALAGLGIAAGTAAIGLGVSAFKGANDFTGAVNDIVAKTGLADDETTKFSDTLKDIYSNNFGENYEDIANAMSQINQQTGLTGKALQKTTENAILLRDTFDFEVNESIRSANMLVSQFGISSEEAYNLIAQGAQKGLDKNGDLLDTINEYSIQFKQMGFSSEEMFAMLINGSASGTFSVDKLGDAVKEFGIRAKDGSKATVTAYKDLGLNADELTKKFATGGEQGKQAFKEVTTALFDMKDPVAQNQVGVSLFGSMWEDLGVEGVKALTKTTSEVDKNSDALKKINDIKYDTPIEALKGLGRTIETDVITPIGEKLMPKITEVVEKLKSPEAKQAIESVATKVSGLINFILNNSFSIISAIAGIAAGLIAWNVASMISGVVTAIKAFQLANQGATIAQALLNGVMNANPAILIVTLIAGLVAAIIALWNTNEDFRNAVIGIWNGIVGVFQGVIDFIKNNWQALLLMIVNPFAGAFKLLYDNCDGFRNFIDTFVSNVKLKIQSAIDTIIKVFWTVIDFVKNNWQGLLLLLVNPFAGAFKLLYDNCDVFRNFIDSFIGKIVGFFKQLPSKIWNAIKGVVNKLLDLKNNMISWATTELPLFISKFVELMQQLPKAMLDIGKNIVSGLWEGISNTTSWLKDKITDFAGGIVDNIKDTLGIHSPSRVLADSVGKYMAQGIGVGFTDEMSSVSTNMVKAIPTSIDDYNSIKVNGVKAGTNISNNSNSGISINIENFVNNRKQDVQAFAEELGFYSKQQNLATGGAY